MGENIEAEGCAAAIEKVLRVYLEHRTGPTEAFHDFAVRHSMEKFTVLCGEAPP